MPKPKPLAKKTTYAQEGRLPYVPAARRRCTDCGREGVTHSTLNLCDQCYREHRRAVNREAQSRYRLRLKPSTKDIESEMRAAVESITSSTSWAGQISPCPKCGAPKSEVFEGYPDKNSLTCLKCGYLNSRRGWDNESIGKEKLALEEEFRASITQQRKKEADESASRLERIRSENSKASAKWKEEHPGAYKERNRVYAARHRAKLKKREENSHESHFRE